MMRQVLSIAVLLFCAVVHASDDPTVALEGVQDLTPETFDKFVNGAKHALIEFYAPWCGHCKRLTPEYKKLGAAVLADPKLKNKVVIAKVDADKHRSLGEKFEIQGFPTIKYFPRGKPATKDTAVNYEQARSSDKFLEYLNQKLAEDKGFARVKILDPLAKEFVSAGDKEGVITKAIAKVESLLGEDKSNGELYIKMMKKAVEKGVDFLGKERDRLERMLLTGKINAAKMDELSAKSSVLNAFLDDEEDEE